MNLKFKLDPQESRKLIRNAGIEEEGIPKKADEVDELIRNQLDEEGKEDFMGSLYGISQYISLQYDEAIKAIGNNDKEEAILLAERAVDRAQEILEMLRRLP